MACQSKVKIFVAVVEEELLFYKYVGLPCVTDVITIIIIIVSKLFAVG